MTEAITIPKLGERMADGTVYAGHSLETGKAVYTTPADAELTCTFSEAKEYARKLNAERFLGHDDWRVPTKGELDVLFNSRAFIGGYDVSGSPAAGWYWSSEDYDFNDNAAVQRFSDGLQFDYLKHCDCSLRCVRG